VVGDAFEADYDDGLDPDRAPSLLANQILAGVAP